jgi:uncharacterized membrane protein
MDNQKTFIYLTLLILSIIVILFSFSYLKKTKKTKKTKKNIKDNFCVCSGLVEQQCRDPNIAKKLYAEGKVTEYNFADNKNNFGQPFMTPYDSYSIGKTTCKNCGYC